MRKIFGSKRKIWVITAIFLALVMGCVAMLAIIGTREMARCTGGTVDLKGMGEIVDYQSEGGILRLRLKKQGSEDIEVVLVDECTGRIKGALTIDDNPLKLPKE